MEAVRDQGMLKFNEIIGQAMDFNIDLTHLGPGRLGHGQIELCRLGLNDLGQRMPVGDVIRSKPAPALDRGFEFDQALVEPGCAKGGVR
jgi:hypothetical protein